MAAIGADFEFVVSYISQSIVTTHFRYV